MKEKILITSMVLLALAFAFSQSPNTGSIGEGVEFTGMMCYQVNDGQEVCSHNTYTDLGKNMTRDRLFWAVGAPITAIGVGNGSAVTTSSDVLDSEISECGLSRATGTVAIEQIGLGNVSVKKAFSVTCSVPIVNTTGIYNATSGNFLWAGDTISPAVENLANGDTLTITWFVWSS